MRGAFGIVGLVFALCGFAFGQGLSCPKITIDGPSSTSTRPGTEIVFTASVEGDDISGLKYKWFVSDGTISKGHDTAVIFVDTTGLNGRTLIATVDVLGLPGVCTASFSTSHFIGGGGHPEQIDEFEGLSRRAENARFDNLGRRMKDEPNISVYIIRYYPKRTTQLAIVADKKRIHSFLNTRWTVETERVVIIAAAFEGKHRTKVYLGPTDSPNLTKH